VTVLPTADGSELIHIELDIEQSYEVEFREMLGELLQGERPRSQAIAQENEQARRLAEQAFDFILDAVLRDPGTGAAPGPRQSRRLVRFLAALYQPTKSQLELSDLRAMDPVYSRACIDCLNFYRLGLADIAQLRPNAYETVHALFKVHGVVEP
jgi:hypothetical protein